MGICYFGDRGLELNRGRLSRRRGPRSELCRGIPLPADLPPPPPPLLLPEPALATTSAQNTTLIEYSNRLVFTLKINYH